MQLRSDGHSEYAPYAMMESMLDIIEELHLWNPDWDFALPMDEALKISFEKESVASLSVRAGEALQAKLYHVWAAYALAGIDLSVRILLRECPENADAQRIHDRCRAKIDRFKARRSPL